MLDYNEAIKRKSEDILSVISDVSECAESILKTKQSSENTAVINSFTDQNTTKKNIERDKISTKAYKITKDEPIYASITVKDENNLEKTYYFTRGYTVSSPNIFLASYRSNIGKLLACDVGDFEELSDKEYEIIQKNEIYTKKTHRDWDARNIFYFPDDCSKDVKSLRDYLSSTSLPFFFDIEIESTSKITRDIIYNMSLRDKPILDKYQDKIFRMDANKQIVLVGPPGTGKTTTLIKKLGLNLDSIYSSISEDKSWYMFTPTKLLKGYLKEAFNRENIAAPDSNVYVWNDFIWKIARDNLPILDTGTRKGFLFPSSFTKNNTLYIKSNDADNQIKWFEYFLEWQDKFYIESLYSKFKLIKNINDVEINVFMGNISEKDFNSSVGVCEALEKISNDLDEYISKSTKKLDDIISKAINMSGIFSGLTNDEIKNFFIKLQTDVNKEFVSYKQNADYDDQDDDDDDEDDDKNISTKDVHVIWKKLIIPSIKKLSRSYINNKKLYSKSLAAIVGRYIDYDNLITNEDKTKIGENIFKVSLLKDFLNAKNKYFSKLSIRYKHFRKKCPEWYNDQLEHRKITSPEIDLLILSYLKINKDFKIKDDSVFFRSQIFVDELMDFSPLQLAIMRLLLTRNSKVFFGAGDFNQSITKDGIKNNSQLHWALPDAQIEEINIPYRQTKQLMELSQLLIGKQMNDIKQPKFLDIEGDNLKPVVEYRLNSIEKISEWLSMRIKEIEIRLDGQLPSIAVLVMNEESILPLATCLNSILEDSNIKVDACLNGNIEGQNNVRVFNIEHIKGLEFEAVFFIDIDILAKDNPYVFDKYLYVGASRAATFLGVTSSGERLPEKLSSLTHLFGSEWSM